MRNTPKADAIFDTAVKQNTASRGRNVTTHWRGVAEDLRNVLRAMEIWTKRRKGP